MMMSSLALPPPPPRGILRPHMQPLSGECPDQPQLRHHNRLLCLCLETHLSLRGPGPRDLDNGTGLKSDLSFRGPGVILDNSLFPGIKTDLSLCGPSFILVNSIRSLNK